MQLVLKSNPVVLKNQSRILSIHKHSIEENILMKVKLFNDPRLLYSQLANNYLSYRRFRKNQIL